MNLKNIFKNILKAVGLYALFHKGYRGYVGRKWDRDYPKNRLRVMRNYEKGKNYLNVGGGKFLQENWRILDYVSPEYPYDRELIDYNINLLEMKPWPVESDSFQLVYSSHAMEHLTDEVGRFVFMEVNRILEKGGIFRITVPDVDLVYAAYKKNDLDFIAENANSPDKRNIFTHFLGTFSSLKPDAVDREKLDEEIGHRPKEDFLDSYIEKQIDPEKHDFSSHATWYNFDKIKKYGEQAGFSQVLLSQKGNSLSEEMRKTGFDHKPGKSNIYVDLVK